MLVGARSLLDGARGGCLLVRGVGRSLLVRGGCLLVRGRSLMVRGGCSMVREGMLAGATRDPSRCEVMSSCRPDTRRRGSSGISAAVGSDQRPTTNDQRPKTKDSLVMLAWTPHSTPLEWIEHEASAGSRARMSPSRPRLAAAPAVVGAFASPAEKRRARWSSGPVHQHASRSHRRGSRSHHHQARSHQPAGLTRPAPRRPPYAQRYPLLSSGSARMRSLFAA